MKKTFLKIRLDDDEYEDFQKSCDAKNKTMSEVIRYFVMSYTKGDNIILLDIDNDTFRDSVELCKEKKIKFNDVIKFLLNKAIKNKDKLTFK
jgi:antitoxin component of RelBE/YafQ-DinJ toxin-antitoxin module